MRRRAVNQRRVSATSRHIRSRSTKHATAHSPRLLYAEPYPAFGGYRRQEAIMFLRRFYIEENTNGKNPLRNVNMIAVLTFAFANFQLPSQRKRPGVCSRRSFPTCQTRLGVAPLGQHLQSAPPSCKRLRSARDLIDSPRLHQPEPHHCYPFIVVDPQL